MLMKWAQWQQLSLTTGCELVMEKTQEVRTQEVRTQEVRTQEVKTQEVRMSLTNL